MENKKNVAIVIQNIIHYYTLKNLFSYLIKKGYTYDIIIPISFNRTSIFEDIHENTYNFVFKKEENVIRESNIKYDVVLEPYEIDTINLDYTYVIKYYYGLLSAKLDWTYQLKNYIKYDAVFLYSAIEQKIVEKFGIKTEVVPFLKYVNYPFNNYISLVGGKKVILFLPTYGEESSLKKAYELIKRLKEEYYVITKLHHGTQYLNDEQEIFENVKNISDEFYGQETNVSKLFQKSHYVITDTSGAFFEAIYLEKPTAIFSPNINLHDFSNELTSFQSGIINEFDLVYSYDEEEMTTFINKTINSKKYLNKIKQIKKSYFKNYADPIESYISVLEKYITQNVDYDVEFRKIAKKSVLSDFNDLKEMKTTLNKMTKKILELENQLNVEMEKKLKFKLKKNLKKIKNKEKI